MIRGRVMEVETDDGINVGRGENTSGGLLKRQMGYIKRTQGNLNLAPLFLRSLGLV